MRLEARDPPADTLLANRSFSHEVVGVSTVGRLFFNAGDNDDGRTLHVQ